MSWLVLKLSWIGSTHLTTATKSESFLMKSSSLYRPGDRQAEWQVHYRWTCDPSRPKRKYNQISKHPANIMVLGIVDSDEKSALWFFVKENEKVTDQVYQNLYKRHFLPWLRANYAPGTYVYQQYGANGHTCALTGTCLEWEKVEF